MSKTYILALFVAFTAKLTMAAPQLGTGVPLCLSDSTAADDVTAGILGDLAGDIQTCSADTVCTDLATLTDTVPLAGTLIGSFADGNIPIGVS